MVKKLKIRLKNVSRTKAFRAAAAFVFCVVFALFFGLAALADSPSNTTHNWYFKTNGEHKQPIVFDGDKMPDKYGTIYLGDPEKKVIYLTFDAGYENGNVVKILDTLKEHGAPAAFFILPAIVRKNPELVLRMASEGHLIGNHSYSHKDMSKITNYNEFLSELTRLEDVCREEIGLSLTKFFRPPEGTFSEQMLAFCKQAGYIPVFWSFAYADWDNAKQKNPDWAYEKIMENIHNGEVILLHPNSQTNAIILGRVLTSLKEQGYSFGSLEDFLPASEER